MFSEGMFIVKLKIINKVSEIVESDVDEALSDIFRSCKGRIILATFASNIYRLVHIIDTCQKNNRKVAVFGRSMVNSIEIAKSCGLIKDKNIKMGVY